MKFKEENKIDMYQMWMATFSSFSNYSDDLISSVMFDTLVAQITYIYINDNINDFNEFANSIPNDFLQKINKDCIELIKKINKKTMSMSELKEFIEKNIDD